MRSNYDQRGDTIIEILLAIAILAFAIGIAYASASKSLQQGISARERSEALNVIENQINSLKLRQKKTGAGVFNGGSGFTVKNTALKNFCLDESANDPAGNWNPVLNGAGANNVDPPDTAANGGPYNPACLRDNKYFIGIEAIDSTKPPYSGNPSSGMYNPTVYKVTVRWERIGGGPSNEAAIYYRF